MKKKLLSLLLVVAMTGALVAGCGSSGSGSTDDKDDSSSAAGETKAVEDLIIGEIQYSVVEDGGWGQAMHEGMLQACENLGIDTSTNLLTMEEISEEDTAL